MERLLGENAEVKAIEVKRGEALFRYESTGDLWEMKAPYEWRADSTSIKRLLDRLRETRLENVITTDEKSYAGYKLKEPETVIELSMAGGKKEKILAGKRGPRYSLIYIRKEGDNRVYLVSSSFMEALPNRRNDFRDRTIVSISEDRIEEVLWKEADRSFHLQRRDDGWYIIKPDREEKASSGDVQDYLGRFSSLVGSGFPEGNRLPDGAEEKGYLRIMGTEEVKLPLYKHKEDWFLLKDGVPYQIGTYLKEQIFRTVAPEKTREKPQAKEQ